MTMQIHRRAAENAKEAQSGKPKQFKALRNLCGTLRLGGIKIR